MSAISSSVASAAQRIGEDQQPRGISAQFRSRIDSAARAMGFDANKIESLAGQIQNAMQGVLRGWGGSGNLQSATRNAVDQVLRDNGVNPATFRQAMDPRTTPTTTPPVHPSAQPQSVSITRGRLDKIV